MLKITSDDVKQILEGVLIGIGSTTDFHDIETCLEISTQIGEDFAVAIEDFSQETV